jgi:hypothetical protein
MRMKHFQKIGEGIDIIPLLNAVTRQRDLWKSNLLRQTFADSPHADVEDVWLRFTDMAEFERTGDLKVVGDDLECIAYPAWHALPQAHHIVFNVMRRVEAERLGRVMITRLDPGKRIKPHSDVLGAYAGYYSRYHVPLQSQPGVSFRAGNEQVFMAPGELWWFDASAEHEVVNNSADDRVHLIIDVRVPR